MAHVHDHRAGDAAVSRPVRRILTAITVGIGVATVIGVVVLWPRHDVRSNSKLNLARNVYSATVTKVHHGPCGSVVATVSTTVRCAQVTMRLTAGPDSGRRRTIEFARSASAPDLHTGDKVMLNHITHAPAGFDYTYNDRQRRPVLLWLFVIFAVAVIALGRLRGLAALVGLGASLMVIVGFALPSMLDGNNPELVAIVGGTAIAYLALYLANGLRPMTTVALLGTLGALALTVALATIFTALAQFTGAQDENAVLVKIGTGSIDLKGLILAGMVLGALGALNDVTITQASSVGELRQANATATHRELRRAGMRIGRDHISSTVNTLALAYAGAALPLLILFSISGQSLGTVANGEIVAIEIVSTLVGSIGLVAAVPFSTWLAAAVATEIHRPSPDAHSRHDELPTIEPTASDEYRTGHDHETGPEVGARTQAVLARRQTPGQTRRVRRPRDERPTEDLLAPRDEGTFWNRARRGT